MLMTKWGKMQQSFQSIMSIQLWANQVMKWEKLRTKEYYQQSNLTYDVSQTGCEVTQRYKLKIQ